MKMLIRILIISITLYPFRLGAQLKETLEEKTGRMQWFKDAKLGIFIHWGIYAVNGIDESWSFYNGYISYDDYMKQLKRFSASKYDPDMWASLIKESGARYAILTSKHHDGVALWNTNMNDLNVAKKAPAGRDLVQPFCDAIRKRGLKVGLYFSLLDWSHPDYPNFTGKEKRYENNPERWKRFTEFNFGQFMELSKNYNPDIFWFDGDWEQGAEKWKAKEIREKLLLNNPLVIINSRLAGYGDYATPEQGIPILKPKEEWWELCMTINDNWGYQHNDKNYKTPYQIIRIFIDCISMGGNLLLNIGPKEDGTIPDEQIITLKKLGRWIKKHSEAIYGTNAGIPPEHFYGPTTLSNDKTVLYLFLPHKPKGPLVIKGLKNQINRIRVVGNGTKLESKIIGKHYWSEVPGILYITVPEKVLDEQVTVIAIQLKGEVDLYRK